MQLLARVLASLFELDLGVVRRFLQFSVDFACFRADLGVGFVDGAAGVFDLEGGVVLVVICVSRRWWGSANSVVDLGASFLGPFLALFLGFFGGVVLAS